VEKLNCNSILACIICLIFCALSGCEQNTDRSSSTDTPQSVYQLPKEIIAQGKLVPRSGLISVGAIPGDRISELKVKIGDRVQAEDVLFVLASIELRQKELALAEGQLADAKSKLEMESQLAKKQVAVAKANQSDDAAFQREQQSALELISIEQRKAVMAQQKLARLETLFRSPGNQSQDLVTETELAEAKLQLDEANAKLEQATTQLATAEERNRVTHQAVAANVDLAKTQSELADQVPLTSLDAAVELAKANLARSTVRAPIDGSVVKLLSHQGDQIGTLPVLQMANTDDMICVAEVYESQLSMITPEKQIQAEITSAALRNRTDGKNLVLKGTVSGKSDLIGQATLIDPNPLAPQDRRTAEVYIELDKESAELASRFINLQVHVRLLLDKTDSQTGK
jgi:HlyD family secretion protein